MKAWIVTKPKASASVSDNPKETSNSNPEKVSTTVMESTTKKNDIKRSRSEQEEEEAKKNGAPTAQLKRVKTNEGQKTLASFFKITTEKKLTLGDGLFDKPTIKLSSWNVNGLRAVLKRGDLQKYLETSDPDIFCMNETKIDEEAFRKANISREFPAAYKHFWTFSKKRAGYSGVAILSKVAPISANIGMGIEKHDEEGRCVTVEFAEFYLVAVYVPNSKKGFTRLDYRVKEWEMDLRAYLSGLKQKKPVILCGDLNVAHEEIDVYNPRECLTYAGFSPEERQEFGKLLEVGFIDTYRELYPKRVQYTYWSTYLSSRPKNEGWRIDYFMLDTRLKDRLVDSIICDSIAGSDHCPVELIINTQSSPPLEVDKQ
eukprot:TRINITY_DN4354_c0_g3_i1.p1 TRINITY_DN4354_c0_g3~~TRINITY_DN4354_c0_g3_i1.p1  ORF type:complete len:372 (-),score=70.14 TRINITY_DN4354_c0_g3_i1:109-1224(-)